MYILIYKSQFVKPSHTFTEEPGAIRIPTVMHGRFYYGYTTIYYAYGTLKRYDNGRIRISTNLHGMTMDDHGYNTVSYRQCRSEFATLPRRSSVNV